MLLRSIFGDDIFISYSRSDGSVYAAGLADDLTKRKFSCFLDQLGTDPDRDLPPTLKRKIRSCTVCVLVGTERALISESVKKEIQEFKRTKRTIIPIYFEGTPETSALYPLIPGLARSSETKEALTSGDPSPSVINRIEKSFNYTRRNQRMRRILFGTSSIFLLLVIASVLAGVIASGKVAEAREQAGIAAEAKKKAEEAGEEADSSKKRAEQQTAIAESAEQRRTNAEDKANEAEGKMKEAITQQHLAESKTKLAESKTKDAEKRRELAEIETRKQQEIAEQRQQEASSRELAANSKSQLMVDAQAGLALAIKAEEMSGTAEAEDALRHALLESRVQAVVNGYNGEATRAAFSPDGQFLVTTGEDNRLRVLKLSNGQVAAELPGSDKSIAKARFSPDGEIVLAISDPNVVLLWQWKTSTAPLRLHVKDVKDAVFAPNGRRFVTDNGTIQVWDASTERGQSLLTLYGTTLNPNRRGPQEILPFFSPDGRFIVAAGDSEASLEDAPSTHVWEVSTGRRLHELQDGGHITAAAFSANGKFMIGIKNRMKSSGAEFWDLDTGRNFAEMEGAGNSLSLIAISPNDKFFVTVRRDSWTPEVWEVPKAGEENKKEVVDKPRWVLNGHLAPVRSVEFSPDGRFILTASNDMTTRVWDVGTGRVVNVLRGHKGAVQSAAFSRDGELMLTTGADRTARVWTANVSQGLAGGGQEQEKASFIRLRSNRHPLIEGSTSPQGTKVYSPDGKYYMTLADDYTQEVRDAATGDKLAARRVHKETVNSAAFSPDNSLIVTASDDKTAQVWEWKTDRPPIKIAFYDEVIQAIFSPDSKAVATVDLSYRNAAQVWELVPKGGEVSWKHSKQLPSPQVGAFIRPARSVAFSPDGKLLLTASGEDYPGYEIDAEARVWDVQKESLALPSLQGHFAPVTSVAFSPDGKFIVTGSKDNTARLWDASTGKTMAELFGHDSLIRRVGFSRDNKFIIVTSDETRFYQCLICGSSEGFLELAKERATWQLEQGKSEEQTR